MFSEIAKVKLHVNGRLIPEISEGAGNVDYANNNATDRNINIIKLNPIANDNIKINPVKDIKIEKKVLNNQKIEVED